MNISELSLSMAEFLKSNEASDIQIFEIDKPTKIAKSLVVCSFDEIGDVKQVAQNFIEHFNTQSILFHKDGIVKGEWVVLDYELINVHIFTKQTREKYNIDKLWRDCLNCIKID